MKLILIRHGKTEGNKLKRYIGRTDEPLADDTVIERHYPEAEIIIASPMKRCAMTAGIIYRGKEIVFCDDFRETDFGDFENKSYEDLRDNPVYKNWLESGGIQPFPNGESNSAFKSRVIAAHENIMKTMQSDSIAYVVHGGTIMAIMQHIFGGDFYDYMVPNLGGYVVDMHNKNYFEIK